jgi:hypothetical protein
LPGRAALERLADPQDTSAGIDVLPPQAEQLTGPQASITPVTMNARHQAARSSASSAPTCSSVIALDVRAGAGGISATAATFRVTTPFRSARRIARTSSERVAAIVRREYPSRAIFRNIASTWPTGSDATFAVPIACLMRAAWSV